MLVFASIQKFTNTLLFKNIYIIKQQFELFSTIVFRSLYCAEQSICLFLFIFTQSVYRISFHKLWGPQHTIYHPHRHILPPPFHETLQSSFLQILLHPLNIAVFLLLVFSLLRYRFIHYLTITILRNILQFRAIPFVSA